MKIVEINAANFLSTGNIMMDIASTAREHGDEVYTFSKYTKTAINYAKSKKQINHFFIGNRISNTLHRYFSWLTDYQDVGNYFSTKQLIKRIKKISPDLIHLHDLVGWYINIGVFFKALKKMNIPILWTMHCCWAYTGRCIYYEVNKCYNWKNGCGSCKHLDEYPFSWFFDHSRWNFNRKKTLFTGIKNMVIVTPSKWLQQDVSNSFLKEYNCLVINNGINLNLFKPTFGNAAAKYGIDISKKIVLFVASAWEQKRKGLKYVFELAKRLDSSKYLVLIVGVTEKIMIPKISNIVTIERTFNVTELAEIYTLSSVFVNPTLDEVFGLVNIEAQACGTPVVTFDSGGSPECISSDTGIVVEKENIEEMLEAIKKICSVEKSMYSEHCIQWANRFSNVEKYEEYVSLYHKIKIV